VVYSAAVAGRSSIDAAFDQLKVPPWGRLLIKLLIWVLVPIFSAIGCALWKLNHDVGVIEGELKNLPKNLSANFLSQADQLVREGKIDEALGAVKLGTLAVADASRKKVAANPDYFRNAIRSINFVQSSTTTVSAFDVLHVARVRLAEYRSVLTESPPLPNLPIERPTTTNHLKPSPGLITFVDMGDSIFDGTKLPKGEDFYEVPPNNPELIATSIKWFTNGSQTLDNMQWTDVTFIHVRVKYFGGRLDLHNVRFAGCPFEIASTGEGDKLADAVAQGLPSFTSSDQPAIHFHHIP